MSIYPRRYLDPQPNPRLWKVRLWISAGLLASLTAFIYSGLAWSLVRPVVHKSLINQYASEFQLDPLWMMAIIKVESRFAASAKSHRGALGLMQLLPSTANDIGSTIGLNKVSPEDLTNPSINLHLGAYYLARLQHQFQDDEIAILAAYNAGPGVTRQWQRNKPTLELEDIPYPETRRFVKEVERTYHFLKFLQEWKHLFGAKS